MPNTSLSPLAKVVYVQLSYCSKRFYTNSDIGKRAGISEKQVRRGVRELCAAGYIAIEIGGGKPNRFRFTPAQTGTPSQMGTPTQAGRTPLPKREGDPYPNGNPKEYKEKEKNSIYSFFDFWNAYGKKVGRAKCEKVYGKLSESIRRTIKEKLPAYVASTPDIQFRKDPLTWLHGKNWEDELPNTVPPAPPAPMSMEELIAQKRAEHEREIRLRRGEVC